MSTPKIKSESSMEPPKAEPSNHELHTDTINEEQSGFEFPSARRLTAMVIALMIAVLLIALDINIIATATPQITTEFNSLDDVAWYGAAYLLTQTALQPTYGRLYSFFNIKLVFAGAMVLIFVGSVVAATAKSSTIVIVGRAIQGCGSAGIFSGGLTMGTYLVPKHKLPFFIAIIGTVFAVTATVGPILGGIFAESKLTWRFCFWINLPIGVTPMPMILVAFREPARPSRQLLLRQKLMSLDPFGAGLLVASLTYLLLALQWGGVSYPWSNSKIWGCFLAFGLLLSTFLVLQSYQKEQALVPLRLLRIRSVAAGCAFTALFFMILTAHVYYLPFYFQAVKGFSAKNSGRYLLPYVVTNTFATFISGIGITISGHYVPFMWTSAAITSIGCGLMYTLDVTSNAAHIIGYQLLTSLGFGLGVQVPITALQAVLPQADIPMGNALTVFFQGLGGALASSIAQVIFLHVLHVSLEGIPGADADAIISYGATNVGSKVPSSLVEAVQSAYYDAIKKTFILPVAASVFAFLCSVAMEWKQLHQRE